MQIAVVSLPADVLLVAIDVTTMSFSSVTSLSALLLVLQECLHGYYPSR